MSNISLSFTTTHLISSDRGRGIISSNGFGSATKHAAHELRFAISRPGGTYVTRGVGRCCNRVYPHPGVASGGMLPSPRPLAKAAALALPASAWTRAAERAGQLNVVVLGTSVSAGCNACDGRGYFSTVLNASLDTHCAGRSEKFCSARAGWAGQLESYLAALLRGTRLTPRVVVHAKNAVGASYFARCARGRVPADTDVVLIDVATNMWNGPQAVGLVLRAVHAAAPSAAIAFVAWLTQVVAMACHDDAPRPNMISVLVMITHHCPIRSGRLSRVLHTRARAVSERPPRRSRHETARCAHPGARVRNPDTALFPHSNR